MNGFDGKKIVASGLIGGASMLAVEMILVPLALGESTWGPLRMMAAILLGRDVLPPPAPFALGVVAVGLAVHAALSIFYASLLDVVTRRLAGAQAVAAGAVFGIVLYAVNFYFFVGLFPWFANARGLVQVLAHVVYGVATATALDALHGRISRRRAIRATA